MRFKRKVNGEIVIMDDAPKVRKPSLVSQSVIDASDKLRAETMEKVNADPKLRAIYDKTRKEAQANIDRHKKVSRSVKLARERSRSKRKLIQENDSLLRALALMRDEKCVVCHTTDNLQVSHIYPKGKYPHMRWLMENVEIRCAGDHKFKKGSPHGDPAGFAMWLIHLPLSRMVFLHEQAELLSVKVDLSFIKGWNEALREMFRRATGSRWGE